MGKPGLKAQTALHRTPTPSRSLFSLLDQSRSAAGVDEPTSSRSIPTEATEVSPTEVEAQAAQEPTGDEAPLVERPAIPPRKRGRPRKQKELKPSEAKKIVQALAEATPGSKVRKVHHMVAAPEDTRVIAEELRTAVIAAEEFRPGTEGRSGHPRRSRFPVLEAWRNERVIYERRPGSAMPQITACEFVKEEILEGGKDGRGAKDGRRKRPRKETGPDGQTERACPACPRCGFGTHVLQAEEMHESLPHHSMRPTASLLRSQASPRKVRKGLQVSFAPESRQEIDSFRHLKELWIDDETLNKNLNEADCAKCHTCVFASELFNGEDTLQLDVWPRSSRFKAICRSCKLSSLFEKVGGWFLMSCAVGASWDAQKMAPGIDQISSTRHCPIEVQFP
ncbi:unnamed protein product [Durusdinium trenchii]|uniref:Uncharacterized protein n=1 Tax=Durusdinium trenchii TaxID=1381693 RepID=A0ABP0QPD2_9DINO